MPNTCPECGGSMVLTKRSERPTEESPATAVVGEEDVDLAAEDIDHKEEISVKAATLVCSRCGNVLAAPEP